MGLVIAVSGASGVAGGASAALAGQPAGVTPASKAAQEALNAAGAEAQSQGRLLLVTYSFDAGKAKQNAERLSRPITAAWIKRHGAMYAVTEQGLIRALMTQEIKQMPGQDPLVYQQGKLRAVLADKIAQRVRPLTPAGDLMLAWRLDLMARPPQEPAGAFEVPADAKPEALLANPFLEELLAARKLAVDGQSSAALKAYATLLSKGLLDEELRSVSASRIAQEMASVLPGSLSKKAFETERQQAVASIIEAIAPRLDVRDARDLHVLLVILRISDQAEEALSLIDTMMNQPTILTLSEPDRELFEILLRHAHWNDPTTQSTDPSAFPKRLHQQAEALLKGADAQAQQRFVTYTAWLAEHEAVRRYAYLATSLNVEHRRLAEALEAHVATWPNGAKLRERMKIALAVQGPRPKK